MLPSFEEIYQNAANRIGKSALQDRYPTVKTDSELAPIPDDRYLASMARAAFSAGFKHYIVDAMWDGFEIAFEGFDPGRVAEFDHEKILELGDDERIVRNKTKIWATVENARMIVELSDRHGSFGEWVAKWPLDQTVQLWEQMADRGHHLGGNTGTRSLRHVGRDTFILTRDVTYALRNYYNVMSYSRRSKSGRREAQEAFLEWRDECGRPMSHISMTLACSLDTPERYSAS